MKQLRGEELVRLNVRVPKKLYEWVKKVAYERDESQSTVVALALARSAYGGNSIPLDRPSGDGTAEKVKKNAQLENASLEG